MLRVEVVGRRLGASAHGGGELVAGREAEGRERPEQVGHVARAELGGAGDGVQREGGQERVGRGQAQLGEGPEKDGDLAREEGLDGLEGARDERVDRSRAARVVPSPFGAGGGEDRDAVDRGRDVHAAEGVGLLLAGGFEFLQIVRGDYFFVQRDRSRFRRIRA